MKAVENADAISQPEYLMETVSAADVVSDLFLL